MNQIISIFTSTFSMSVPLILAALGGVISVRSGIMALEMWLRPFSAALPGARCSACAMGF